jgi:DNA-binding CsgD family transcriptional regulator
MLVFQRLAFHLASAHRLRRRLAETGRDPLGGYEALFDPGRGLIEANGPAENGRARSALESAAVAREEVRQGSNRQEPTDRWRPRVSGRWTLVDAVSRRGQRYIVARENEVQPPGLDDLTGRELQVVASAAAGRSNKEIAYELGISHATVRVLLSRAGLRLGVRSRRQLLQLPSIRGLRGELPKRK